MEEQVVAVVEPAVVAVVALVVVAVIAVEAWRIHRAEPLVERDGVSE